MSIYHLFLFLIINTIQIPSNMQLHFVILRILMLNNCTYTDEMNNP